MGVGGLFLIQGNFCVPYLGVMIFYPGYLCWPDFKESFPVDLLIFRNNTRIQLLHHLPYKMTGFHLTGLCCIDPVDSDFDFSVLSGSEFLRVIHAVWMREGSGVAQRGRLV